MHIHLITTLIFSSLLYIINTASVPNLQICGLESSCEKNVTEESEVCVFDEESNCLRKYASKCHMEIARCHQKREMGDYSDVYCQMKTYLCEESPSYERWTIFYQHEKD